MILFAFGLLLSVAWLWAGWYYVSVYVGVDNIFLLLPVELGQFLIGFLAPLGIFWLLISQSATRRRLARLERKVSELASPGDGTAAAETPGAAPESRLRPGGLPPADERRREPSLAPGGGAAAADETTDVGSRVAAAAASGSGSSSPASPDAAAANAPPKPPGNASAPRLSPNEAKEPRGGREDGGGGDKPAGSKPRVT